VVSRQILIDSPHSTVICAPDYSRHDGLSTQVEVGIAKGLKQNSSIHCDNLVSHPQSVLTNYIGTLNLIALSKLDAALNVALELEI
jgi:mRNA interferase MazF